MDAYAPLDQHLKKRILAAANDRIRFWSLIGMQIEDVRKGWALIRVPFDEN
jgi:acyl-coenzyme A thioesterase PaaI-like protein